MGAYRLSGDYQYPLMTVIDEHMPYAALEAS